MINFHRSPSAPATKRQRAHVSQLISIRAIRLNTMEADVFVMTAIDFCKAFDAGTANQQMYADTIEAFREINW